jgi:AraC-like DNA-binding protein
MTSPNPVLTTIIFVFALQAVILSVLLLVKRPRRQANLFLALLVFFFALMALNIALVNVLSAYDLFYAFRYVQLELLYGIGPALYFYTKSITDPESKFSKKDFLHFIPVLLEFVFYRTSLYRLGADGMYQTPPHPYTKFYLAEQWGGILSITVYTMLSLWLLYRYQAWLKQQYSNLKKRSLNWLKVPVIVYSAFWIGWNLLTEIDRFVFDRALRETYFLPTFAGLAAVTYWIGFKGYLRTQTTVSGFSKSTSKKHVEGYDAELADEITSLMEKELPYLNPDLDLTGLSELLDRNPRQVSHTINRSFSKNFYEYVNQYRVEAFKKRMQDPERDKMTLLGHALESGFKSKSTFNDVFKKATGLTPSQYVKGLRKRSEEKQSDD